MNLTEIICGHFTEAPHRFFGERSSLDSHLFVVVVIMWHGWDVAGLMVATAVDRLGGWIDIDEE